MKYRVTTDHPARKSTPCLILGVFEGPKLSGPAALVDEKTAGRLQKILDRGDFEGKAGDTLPLYDVPGAAADCILLTGLGKPEKFDLAAYRKAVAKAIGLLQNRRPKKALCTLSAIDIQGADTEQRFRDGVLAAEAAVYRFDPCKSEKKPPARPLKKIKFQLEKGGDPALAERGLRHGQGIAAGVRQAKDLSNLPGNLCTPAYLAEQSMALGGGSDQVSVQVLEEAEMETLGMGALLSVSKGSRQPAKLIVMHYQGGKPKAKPVVLVGKGLTFDAGGISLKPAAAMDEMKYDMCGGASVIGALRACAEMELPLNVIGVVPASENLPDGAANKPGDIVTAMSGQTIEILNTDAEGRLILCDALTYVERFKPAAVVDIATLTGACIIALGKHASGLLANDDALAEQLLAAGESTGDRAWRLPLWEDYQSQLDSNFADLANIGGKGAGAITAACFLSRFTKNLHWAHLDIAGSAWNSGKAKGATGRPVPLLCQFLINRCKLGE